MTIIKQYRMGDTKETVPVAVAVERIGALYTEPMRVLRHSSREHPVYTPEAFWYREER